jgi:hypothetical protein
MATITEVKAKMLDKLNSMDLEHMTIMDASLYVDVLRKLSDISEKTYIESLMETMEKGFGKTNPMPKPMAVGYALGGGCHE